MKSRRQVGMRAYQRSRVPDTAVVHPLVRRLWELMNDQQASQQDVAVRAGVSTSGMRKWRSGRRMPKVMEIDACLQVFGYHVVAVPIKESDREAERQRREAASDEWVVVKRGYFYRPGSCGYTAVLAEAGRYTRQEAEAEAAVEPENIKAYPISRFLRSASE